ncbi:MAG TPA: metalloregulator ArsR/SmtB family transcription factor [Armatimonadota bacterium]|nr:metalloregulator ArsR/SmtB family transcription factor [Armatimonadota bacterium]
MTRLARIFQALGNDARLSILREIAKRREACVCEVIEATGMGQSAVSHHLAVLRNAGVVRDRKSGLWVIYSIDRDLLQGEVGAFLSELVECIENAPPESPEVRLALSCKLS